MNFKNFWFKLFLSSNTLPLESVLIITYVVQVIISCARRPLHPDDYSNSIANFVHHKVCKNIFSKINVLFKK